MKIFEVDLVAPFWSYDISFVMNTLIYLRLVIFTFKFICISMKTKHSNMGVWHNHVNTSTLTAPCLNVGRCSKLETRQTSVLARCSGIQTTWPEFMWTGANNSTGVEGWFGFCGCRELGVRLETQAWRNDHHSEEGEVTTNIWRHGAQLNCVRVMGIG